MSDLIKGNTGDWQIVIGLEVHAQVNTKTKLFSRAENDFGREPNSNVSFVDSGFPGMLPVINEVCVKQAVKTGLGIKAQINKKSVFDRKNYFYADLPQGYQISQFKDPIVGEGELEIELKDGSKKQIGIERIHLEQDAGKSLHDQSPTESFIDLNRSGVPLMEIVSKPDMRSSFEAGEYMKKLRSILRYLETCSGDMEKGALRCDANVSVCRPGTEFGTRNEIKNLNSIKNIIAAIDYEAMRQVEVLESGGEIEQATRLFDVDKGETRVMRSKEDAHDYRYFPDPDLYPLVFDDSLIAEVKKTLPELPDEKKLRYKEELGISDYDADVIVSDKFTAEYFEDLINNVGKDNGKLAASWLTGELFGRLNKENISLENSPVASENLANLIGLIKNNTISGKIAKDVLDLMFKPENIGKKAEDIVEEKGLKQVTDSSEIDKIIEDILSNNADKVEEYKSGKDKLFGFFVGQVMKASRGKANPQIVNELLKEKL